MLSAILGIDAIFSDGEQPAESAASVVIQVHVRDTARLLGGEKFKEDIDGAYHIERISKCLVVCNRWICEIIDGFL